MKLKKIFALFWILCSGVTAFGQTSNEIGLFLGGSHFIGDVGQNAPFIPTGYAIGLNYRHQFNPHYAIRGTFNYGMVAQDDALSSWDSRKVRNLSFRSPVIEGAVLVEINFLSFVPGSKKMTHSPYIFGGIGVFGFNPQANYENQWYDLRPLGTEGQGTNLSANPLYSKIAWSIPFGIGYRWRVSDKISMAAEVGWRGTSTDYLDDVSGVYVDPVALENNRGEIAAALSNRSTSTLDQTGLPRGNSQTRDWYIFTGIHFYVELSPFLEKCANFIGQ